MGLFSSKKTYIGVDIGTSGIKIVELRQGGNNVILENYGFSERRKTENTGERRLDQDYAVGVIKEICKKAGITSKNAVAALPTFSVFSSIINLSNVPEKALDSAVKWEAKKIIPLPLDEMVIDWKKIENNGEKTKDTKVLLTAAPKSLVNEYIEIFKRAQINLLSLETETFSLVRSLLGNDKSTIMIVELGASTTDISIVYKSIPVLSRSIDIGGSTITKAISNNLNIGIERSEQFKYDLGISSFESRDDVVPKAILETLVPVVNEINYALNLFKNKNNKEVEKIILSGGSAMLANFVNYLSRQLDKKVIIGNPWAQVIYPNELKSTLDEIGPRLAVATGLAMREIG